MSKNTRNILLIVLSVLILGSSLFMLSRLSRSTEKTDYSEIISLIEQNKISEFELNLYNGDLSYKLRSDDKKIHHFTVANYSIFYEDISDAVKEINKNAKSDSEKITFNYVRGGEGAWLTNMLPSLLPSATSSDPLHGKWFCPHMLPGRRPLHRLSADFLSSYPRQ